MSKRRSRKKQPNLPAETLARARREAGLEEAPDEQPEATPDAAAPTVRTTEALPSAQRRKRRREVNVEELTQAEIAELLAHPTKQVSTDELRSQYTYVVSDLRGMGVLAALLFVVMIAAARFL
jgi:DNA-directed RNA polymerase specialized sigma24 family protein